MNRFFVAAMLIALLGMSAVAISQEMPLLAMLGLWGLLGVNGAIANWIDHHAVLTGARRPLFWGLALNSARFFILVAGIGALCKFAGELNSVIVMALIGYFAFLSAQIGYLHVQSLKVSHAL